jgi:hypothetical protein
MQTKGLMIKFVGMMSIRLYKDSNLSADTAAGLWMINGS